LHTEIILASSSPFRKQLLDRLHLNYSCHSPDIDESIKAGESASDYVTRLALAKAQSVSDQYPGAIIIGSDQCALLEGEILGKPGTHERALQQLKNAQGKTVVFHTGLCVLKAEADFCDVDEVLYEVDFRQLSDAQLEHYLEVEQPYNCAGSFKSEAYGACLFSKMRGDDPSALIGLPLLRLIKMLEQVGVGVV
jgi:septum formation protein